MIAEAPFLFSVAALSVSLAGFAGLIAAFRRGGEWRPMDLFRVREIVEFGFVSAFLALLTIPLAATLHDLPLSVSIVCGLAALYLVVTTFALVRRLRGLALPFTFDWYLPAALVSVGAFTAALVGFGSGDVAWLMWTLLLLLGRPMLAFVFVLTLLRRDGS